jgi:cytochrome c-type protein NrfB
MRNKLGLLMLPLIVLAALAVWGQQDNGAPEMELAAGERGDVAFPHLQHQNVLEDCNLCHSVFPQQAGSILSMKAAGTLKPRQVMNKQCIKCHRTKKKEGVKTGPLTCSKCHVL